MAETASQEACVHPRTMFPRGFVERRDVEQYFWTRSTVHRLIKALKHLPDCCCMAAPSLAVGMHIAGRDERLLDIDRRMDFLPGFQYWVCYSSLSSVHLRHCLVLCRVAERSSHGTVGRTVCPHLNALGHLDVQTKHLCPALSAHQPTTCVASRRTRHGVVAHWTQWSLDTTVLLPRGDPGRVCVCRAFSDVQPSSFALLLVDIFSELAPVQDIQAPVPVSACSGQAFRVIIFDPPFFYVSMAQLYAAVLVACKGDTSTKLMLGFLRREEPLLMATFKQFKLRPTKFVLEYAHVKPNKWRNYALYSNVDLPGIKRLP